MNVLNQLKRQMRVISNPRHGDSIGGFRLFFVGTGVRFVDTSGWWRTKLNFYTIDAANLPYTLRFPGKKQEFVRNRSSVFLHAPNVPYEEHFEGRCHFEDAWIAFRETRPDNPLARMVRKDGFRQFRDENGLIKELLDRITHIADSDPSLRWSAQAAFLSLLAHLYQASPHPSDRIYTIRPLMETNAQPDGSFRLKVSGILRETLAKNLTFGTLAAKLGVSRSALSHRFSSEMGETFTAMVNRLRMEKAQELLTTTDKQVKEIAYAVGFDDHAYFSRKFRVATGVPPSSFRSLISSAS